MPSPGVSLYRYIYETTKFYSIAAYLVQLVLAWCYFESNYDKTIHKELIALKKEMNNISMVDEFARYAKLQRKYKKLKDEAEVKINARYVARIKLKMMLTYSLRIAAGISTSILLLLYRNEPVIVFSKGYLWPFESVFSFPANVDSCISLPVWILMVRLSITRFTET
ncbi:guided entry of tail-anchored proteins factor 1 [Phymastichus coffea]|uniref:guided entry of tail-anchored proteins factor 1 n=1 Tax=Phymastichus coffea TaxID=108790 RepID=UPI00273CCE9D|nr:guided entry of tail-anchored proteins factor 1 [Phymastichus coffea]